MAADADIVLPMTAANPFVRYMNSVALRTLRASTDARILILANTTEEGQWREQLEIECKAFDAEFRYYYGPFSQSRFWNVGTALESARYVVYANADSIFYPSWLERLIELWELEPDYYALWPWSYHIRDMGLAYRPGRPTTERRIVATHHPAVALVMRRESGYVWDEQFAFWEMDADFMHHCSRNGHRTGLCLWSRVDHFSSSVTGNIDSNAHFAPDAVHPTTLLKRKWNLP